MWTAGMGKEAISGEAQLRARLPWQASSPGALLQPCCPTSVQGKELDLRISKQPLSKYGLRVQSWGGKAGA